jgi:hypothetical protein
MKARDYFQMEWAKVQLMDQLQLQIELSTLQWVDLIQLHRVSSIVRLAAHNKIRLALKVLNQNILSLKL